MESKKVYESIFQQRTFGNEPPKIIRKNIDEEIYRKIKHKDVTIHFYVQIEEN